MTETTAGERACGACSLCCTVLRVEELSKLGGTPCIHQRTPERGGGCSIHASRPAICRAYECLWLRGSLREGDRPDRLGAVLDVVARGPALRLEIREAEPGAFERSTRLREIAEAYRGLMPVRITDVGDVFDPERPFRVLLPGGEERRVSGEQIAVYRDDELVAHERLPWAERLARRVGLAFQRRVLRRLRARSGGA